MQSNKGVVTHGHGSTARLVRWAKVAAFGVFHSMTEKTTNRVTMQAQMWRVSLLTIDAIQVAVLTLKLEYGWATSFLGWLNDFSLMNLLLPNRDARFFNLVYALVVLTVWFALADAVYVRCVVCASLRFSE